MVEITMVMETVVCAVVVWAVCCVPSLLRWVHQGKFLGLGTVHGPMLG